MGELNGIDIVAVILNLNTSQVTSGLVTYDRGIQMIGTCNMFIFFIFFFLLLNSV